MKIGSIEAKPAVLAPSAERKVAAPAGTAAEASAKVELSTTARLAAGDDGTFDAGKVDAIAAAIRDGKFKVNAEAIADKLIVNAEELLGRKLS